MKKKSEGTSATVVPALKQGFLASGALEIQPSINSAVVGDTVTLSLSPSATMKSESWQVGESLILTWLGNLSISKLSVFTSHSGRASVNILTGALTLSSVIVAGSGVHMVQSSDPQIRVNATFTVLDQVHSQSIYASQNPIPVGSNVTLVSNVSVMSGGWVFNNRHVVVTLNGIYMISKAWKDRVIFNTTTSSLTIKSLNLEDSGEYALEDMDLFFSQLTLSVQDPVSNVTLQATATNLLEFSGTEVLMCTVSKGTPLFYQWLNGSSVITANEKVQLSKENATLTIVGVTRYDQGPYKCTVFNGVSNETSSPLNLNISYGPSNTKMTIVPQKNIYKGGSNITLSCSAESSPPAMIQWKFNGMFLNQTGSNLQLENVDMTNSGNYTCLLHNIVTSNFSSATTEIQIVDPVTAVVVNLTRPAILGEMFSLRCEVTGAVDIIYWWKNDHLISADNNTAFSTDNKTLTLNSVLLSDGGNYLCQAFNSVSNLTSNPYTVTVYYGPDTATAMGPNLAKAGDNITFSCNASSTPPSLYKWYFKGFLVSNESGYVTPPLTTSMSGKYICVAFNSISGKNSTAYIMLTVFDPIKNVAVEAQMIPAKEGYSYNLTCTTDTPTDYIYWMKNGEPLHEDNRIVFYMGNNTVHFNVVERYDTGEYHCLAINAVGNMTSPAYMLIVNYGPDTTIIYGPAFAATGSQVVFSCSAISVPPSQFCWWFSGSIVANTSVYTTGLLSQNMSGQYTCMAINNVTGKNSTNSTTLTVIDPIKNVAVEPQMIPANEGARYNLTCKINGPPDYIYWMKDGEILHEDNRTVFYMDNKTVLFNPVVRSDTAQYRCMAINAVGNMTSPPYTLIVNYGPETPIIYGPAFAETGSQAVFNCSAISVPPSQFCWWFNGSIVANKSVYTTGLLSRNMSGQYTCMAINNVTGKNSTNSTTLTVIEAIQSVMIKNETVPINNINFTLTCEVIGPYDMIYWMKDNMKLNTSSTNSNMSNNIKSNMLQFTPLTMSSDGAYQCVAISKAGQHVSPQYRLLVNYGPLKLSISRENMLMFVSLTCKADSRPVCDFHWFFNNLSTPLQNGPVINIPATKKYFGDYICKAWNPVTNIIMYQNFNVTGHASAIHFPYQGSLMMMVLFAMSSPVLFN